MMLRSVTLTICSASLHPWAHGAKPANTIKVAHVILIFRSRSRLGCLQFGKRKQRKGTAITVNGFSGEWDSGANASMPGAKNSSVVIVFDLRLR